MDLLSQIVARAKANKQRIVLPEAEEERTLKAADKALGDDLADLILIGNPDNIKTLAAKWNLKNIDKATIVDPLNNPKTEEYAEKLAELRKKKGMTIEQIVPDEIPDEGSAEMDSIKARAYSKPHVARKLISPKGDLSWIMVKLRAFPKDSVWKKTSTVAPDIITGEEVERIIKKPEYASLHPKGTGMPYVTHCKTVYISKEMGQLMMIATLICMVVMLLMTRSLRGVVAPIISVIGGLFTTYGIAGFTQMYVDSTVLMIPTILAFAVAIAYNIHIGIILYFNYMTVTARYHKAEKRGL